MTEMRPFYENVQAHYDLSNDFFFLFLDPSRTYSCAYFERDDYTLEEAQLAKLDLALGKCDLQAGQRVLDIGCGWGSSCRRAAEQHGVHVIGLTLSKNQHAYCQEQFARNPVSKGQVEVRLQGWEEVNEPVDRIVCIASFEAFRRERYNEFFDRCRSLLPADGRMLLHTIILPDLRELDRSGMVTHEAVLFIKFISKEIFPGGELCEADTIVRHAEKAGFTVERMQSLRLHYAKTLTLWASKLESARQQALEIVGQEVYDRYMKYLTGCAKYFASGHVDVMQFTLRVDGSG